MAAKRQLPKRRVKSLSNNQRPPQQTNSLGCYNKVISNPKFLMVKYQFFLLMLVTQECHEKSSLHHSINFSIITDDQR